MERIPISLEPSEQALLAAASRIFSAYVASGQVAEGQEDGWRARSIRDALWLAQRIDETVAADEEVRS